MSFLFPNRFSRPLSAGETALVQSIFGNTVDCAAVRIFCGCYLPFGLQNRHTAMSPNGHLYFPEPLYCSDFAAADRNGQSLFVHEMTHVWQFRLGYRVKLNALLLALRGGYGKRCRAYRCRHLLPEKQDFSEFNMEQQARLMEYWFHAPQHPDLQRIMARFRLNPNDRALLPQHTRF